MHILFLNYIYDDRIETPDALIDEYRVIHEWCRAVKDAGAESVIVVQRFSQSAQFHRDGIEYYFIDDGLKPALQWWSRPSEVNTFTAELVPDVVHVNGIVYFLRNLRRTMKNGTAILLQSHFNRTPNRLVRRRWKRALTHVDGVILTSVQQAVPWKERGIITPSLDLFEAPVASTHFQPLPYSQCRSELGINGQTLYLWVGRLHFKKDPVTVIRGFSKIAQSDPGAYLYMIFSTSELVAEVQNAITENSLSDRVRLIGYIPHNELSKYYSASDFFVLGSQVEVCGFALIEALSCGVTPVVTDIPSFRYITGNGRAGFLWRPGNPESFFNAARKSNREKPSREFIRSYFEKNLSYEVLGKNALNMYNSAYRRRQERIA